MRDGDNIFKVKELTLDALLEIRSMLDDSESVIKSCEKEEYLSQADTGSLCKKATKIMELTSALDSVAKSVNELKTKVENWGE